MLFLGGYDGNHDKEKEMQLQQIWESIYSSVKLVEGNS